LSNPQVPPFPNSAISSQHNQKTDKKRDPDINSSLSQLENLKKLSTIPDEQLNDLLTLTDKI
jgi:hypothetical protein